MALDSVQNHARGDVLIFGRGQKRLLPGCDRNFFLFARWFLSLVPEHSRSDRALHRTCSSHVFCANCRSDRRTSAAFPSEHTNRTRSFSWNICSYIDIITIVVYDVR